MCTPSSILLNVQKLDQFVYLKKKYASPLKALKHSSLLRSNIDKLIWVIISYLLTKHEIFEGLLHIKM